MQPPFASPEEALEWKVLPCLTAAMAALYARRIDEALNQLAQAVAALEAADPSPHYRIVWEASGTAGAFLAVEGRLTPGQMARLEALGATLDRLLDAASEDA